MINLLLDSLKIR